MNRISIFPKRIDLVGACLVVFLAIVSVDPAPARDTAREVIRATSDKVLEVLGDDALSPDEKRKRIERIVVDDVDFDTLSRLVLARHWRTLSDVQKEEFVEEFKEHLSVTYGKNVENFGNERIEIVGEREEARGDHTVQTKVVRKDAAESILMDYRLRRKDGDWKIIDVIIEGVSLVSNFRSQFQEIMASDGFDRLIRLLRKKNEKGEALEAAPSA